MMDKKGIGKQELLEILLFVIGAIIIIGAIITIWPNLFRLSGTESLRAKVDLAATTKDYTKGLIGTPAENFRCELGQDPREYWTDLSQEVVAQKILDRTYAVHYAYGEGKRDFYSSWAAEYFASYERLCYVCYVVSNGKYFGSGEEWNNLLLNNEYYKEDNYFVPLWGYDSGNSQFTVEPSQLEIGPQNPLFIGYVVEKWEPSLFSSPSAVISIILGKKEFIFGLPFVFSENDLNNYCRGDVYIEV